MIAVTMVLAEKNSARAIAALATLAAAAGLLLTACSTTTTELRVADPRRVALYAHDVGALPGATLRLAVPGGAAGEELERSATSAAAGSDVVYTFENFVGRDEEVRAVRRPDGAVVLSCPRCWARRVDRVLVTPDGRTTREDARLSTSRGDAVLPFVVRLGRRSAFDGAYVTPWSNVREIRERTGADPRLVGGTTGGVPTLLLGTALAAVGTTLVVVGVTHDTWDDGRRRGYVAVGSAAAVLGFGVDAFALWHLLGPSTTRVYPPGDPAMGRAARGVGTPKNDAFSGRGGACRPEMD